MKIGIPKEIKQGEARVGATPSMVRELTDMGAQVFVENNAGQLIGFTNQLYEEMGAKILFSAEAIYKEADMIIKVKEPQSQEISLLREGQILFCYLHLAPDRELTEALLKKKIIGIAYETVTDAQGRLPLLEPMSAIAGRISIQMGGTALQVNNGGKGILLGGVPGVPGANVVILGGGTAGFEAARMAKGVGASVSIIEKQPERLKWLDAFFKGEVKTIFSTASSIEDSLKDADLVIGAVLIQGKKAPKLVTRKMLQLMEKGSCIVDISIDQGGCFETSRPTTHEKPTYIEEGIIHYCVTNMPGAAAKTATYALTMVTIPFVKTIVNLGLNDAFKNPHLLNGLNVCYGDVCYEGVAHDLGYPYTPAEKFIGKL
ncbi:alanine dehydrogenase [Criblamydia sequanensis]|uniref:Alanine dehydrogenase n=1 Tax=Candidatus Criblamydia sequanensis CRIB-18 TaxID=1437425 RepID=A0A090CZA4_9BACT|nr:alanine dehydrogenase [Criblamydia sequanensis]CDR34151.1 Alanine dehydrogenase [Criblamydia sequanensis CRIB-18]